jgi:opacity protein-like surface antigen
LRTTAIAVFLLGAALAASAQIPGGNVYVGYSYTRADIFSQSLLLQPPSHAANFNGWQASLEGKFLPFIGVVADVSQTYGSANFSLCGPGVACSPGQVGVDSRLLTVMVGARASVSVSRFTPFAEALFGGAHASESRVSASDTSLATAIGGGLDYKLIKGVAWRFQGDALHTHLFGAGQNNLRLSTGLVLRF